MFRRFTFALLLAFGLAPSYAKSFEVADCEKLFFSGQYRKAIDLAKEAIEERERDEGWRVYMARAQWELGEYDEASKTITAGLRAVPYSVRLRLLAWTVYRSNGEGAKASAALDEVNELGGSRRWGYRDPESVVAIGEGAVLLGIDPKVVLDNFFEPAKKSDPNLRAVYLAIGNLALDKHDFALAAKNLQEGLKHHPGNPDLLLALAKAYAAGDRQDSMKTLEELFEKNPNSVEGRLLVVDHMVDAEEYDEAEKELKKIEAVNPRRPEAWAYKAVLDHLREKPEQEKTSREQALKSWSSNPQVDYIIGRKLSQKYRFAEGATYQKQALRFDRDYLPAKIQLAQDLLRLGEDTQGWELAEEVNKADAYDIAAYNLVTLKDTIGKFVILTNADFRVRMSPRESAVYGQDVLKLLEKARQTLSKKYSCPIDKNVVVEIFPEQKDFAIRTFGMPGGEGYLGVCFGNVITANSPASRRNDMNWQSMLWHEFCHVITLRLTKNKMPRWLSEGISVYEERQANPTWGEKLTPAYREMIMKGEMKPVGNLSAAFMAPKTPMHLQFAYYQSSLVVQFLVETYGIEDLKAILRDLGEGKQINDAIAAHTTEMPKLEKAFTAYAKKAAEEMGPDPQWLKPKRDPKGEIDPDFLVTYPENIWVLREKASKLVEAKKWSEAEAVYKKIIELYPQQTGSESAYGALAHVYRELNKTQEEKSTLKKWISHDPEASEGLLRLLELETAEKNWKDLALYSEKLLAVNPFLPQVHRALAASAKGSGEPKKAIHPWKTLLLLDPPDASEVHYQLAKTLRAENPKEARLHVLQALEDAPRYREAHKLLLEIASESEKN